MISLTTPLFTSTALANTQTSPLREALNDREQKRQQAMQEGIARLRAMPSAQQIQKQNARDKIARLKQRLEMLKQLMRYASPALAKSLARELKSIAGELNAAAKTLAGSNAGAPATANDNTAASTPSPAETATATQTTTAAPAATETALDGASTANEPTTEASAAPQDSTSTPPSAPNASPASSASTDQRAEDAAARNELREAKNLLQKLLQLLKARLAQGDKESQQALQAIQHQLANLDAIEQQQMLGEAYAGITSETGLSGLSIDLRA